MWSSNRPTSKKNSNKYTCKVVSSYSLTENGINDLYFMTNSKKETIVECLKSLRRRNPKGIILLIIYNLSSQGQI